MLGKGIEKANQISIQIRVLEELDKRSVNSLEPAQFIESLGDYYCQILPVLKNSGFIKTEPAKPKNV